MELLGMIFSVYLLWLCLKAVAWMIGSLIGTIKRAI